MSHKNVVHVKATDTEWTTSLVTGLGGDMEVRRLLTREGGASERFAMVMARTAAGGEHGWHTREEEEAIVVVEGECTLSQQKEDGTVVDFRMTEGDAAFIPAKVTHMNRNSGATTNLILGIHSPAHL